MDLEDEDRFLASKGMKDIAASQGWWDKENEAFNFFQAFAQHSDKDLGGKRQYVWRRQWRVYSLVAPSLGLKATDTTFPLAVRPDAKLSLDDVFDILRDHYEGTEWDMTKGIAAGPFGSPARYDTSPGLVEGGAWERPISIYRGLFAFVAVVRPELPDCIGGQLWYGWDQPNGAVFHPIYVSAESLPDGYDRWGKQSVWEEKSSWRPFNLVNNWVNLRYDHMSIVRKATIREWQNKSYQVGRDADAQALAAWTKGGKMAAGKVLAQVCNAHARSLVAQWWTLFHNLSVRFANNYDLKGEGADEWTQLEYPAWWLELTDYVSYPHEPPPPPLRSNACNISSSSPSPGPSTQHGKCGLGKAILVGGVSGLLVFVAAEVTRRFCCAGTGGGEGSGYLAM